MASGLKALINKAKQQGALKRVTIIDNEIPNDVEGRLHAKREEEKSKRITELNVTELVEERTATSRQYKPN